MPQRSKEFQGPDFHNLSTACCRGLANNPTGQIRSGERAVPFPGASGPGDRDLGRCSVKSVSTTALLTLPHSDALMVDKDRDD